MKWPFSRSLSAKLKINSDSFLSCSFSLRSIFQVCPLPSLLDNIHPARLPSALAISRKPSQTAQFPLFIGPSSPPQAQGAETSAPQFFEAEENSATSHPCTIPDMWRTFCKELFSWWLKWTHLPHLHCRVPIVSYLGVTTGLTTTVLSIHLLCTLWLEFACKTLMWTVHREAQRARETGRQA